MPAKKKSATGATKKTAAKRSTAKRSSAKRSAPQKHAANTQERPASTNASAVQKTEDRLSGVARTIGSTVGGLVKKTKKVLNR